MRAGRQLSPSLPPTCPCLGRGPGSSLSSCSVLSFNSSVPSINLTSCKYESGKSEMLQGVPLDQPTDRWQALWVSAQPGRSAATEFPLHSCFWFSYLVVASDLGPCEKYSFSHFGLRCPLV